MKIAFLFLTIEDVNFPDLWEMFFNDSDKYNIYCHAKYPDKVKVPWLKNNIIKDYVETSWGRIVEAYILLMKEALKNEENMKFVVVSESCVPLKSLTKMYNYFLKHDIKNSYIPIFKGPDHVNLRINGKKGYERIEKYVKHYARFCLSRYHCEQVVNDERVKFFYDMDIGDEHFLSVLNFDKYIINKSITFDNWIIVNKKIDILKKEIWLLIDSGGDENEIKRLKEERNNLRKNPHTYYTVNNNDVIEAIKTGAFIWRKIDKNCNIRSNKLYMKQISS